MSSADGEISSSASPIGPKTLLEIPEARREEAAETEGEDDDGKGRGDGMIGGREDGLN